jgi:hypothetical protein
MLKRNLNPSVVDIIPHFYNFMNRRIGLTRKHPTYKKDVIQNARMQIIRPEGLKRDFLAWFLADGMKTKH